MSLWSAGRYESVAEQIAPLASRVVTTLDRRRPLRDSAVVDLACGTGNAALAAAAAGARVTGVDITAELLAIAAAKPGGANVQWLVADASATGLPDAAFDAVLSNMGIIFVEPTAQVAEIARLLRPGGLLGFSTWVRDADNPFFTPIVEVLGTPPAGDFSPDQWGQPGILTERLTAQFDEIVIENDQHTWEFPSLDDAVRFVTEQSPMHVDILGRVDEAARTRLVLAFTDALATHRQGATVAFPASYAVVTARRH